MNKSSIVEITLARFMAFCDGFIFDEEIAETVNRTDLAIMRQVATSASDEAIARIARSSLMDRADVRPAIEYELQVRNLLKNGPTPGVHVQWTSEGGTLDAIQRKRMFDALERLSTAKSDEDQRVAANEIAGLRRPKNYPAGLPKKYQPVADEWRRLGWEVHDFVCFDYGDQLKLVISRNDERKFALLHAECEEVVFDVLDTPWWASVQKRQEQAVQAAVNE